MSMYRSTVWFLKGLSEYTKNGYLAAAKKFKPDDLDVDCTGRIYMITGSNSGIGKQTALEIAKRGGTVHMVCRNPVLAEEAKKYIVDSTKNEKVHVHIVDLSDPRAVHAFAANFSSGDLGDEGLDVLINNAGCMIGSREVTSDGLEKNFATNTLGTHIITEGLLPIMLRGGSHPSGERARHHGEQRPRVITVSSGGMLTTKLDVKDLQTEKKDFDGTMVYAQNKRQQVIMTENYAKKYPDIQFTSMHPGWADTPAVRSSMPGFYEKMKNKLRTVEQGADTVIWLAISQNPEAIDHKNSGAFFQDRTPVAKHLPLACSRSTPEDEALLMEKLDEYFTQFKAS